MNEIVMTLIGYFAKYRRSLPNPLPEPRYGYDYCLMGDGHYVYQAKEAIREWRAQGNDLSVLAKEMERLSQRSIQLDFGDYTFRLKGITRVFDLEVPGRAYSR